MDLEFHKVHYQLKECGVGDAVPQNQKELFNMRHSKARNIIERAFAMRKMRWRILRSASFYPIQYMACFLLHNFIRREMSIYPVEAGLDGDATTVVQADNYIANDYVECVEPTHEWTALRDSIAMNMWNHY
ncbi:uncharacterized protein LOC125186116 [Salvia hispanica]|uniref:uncharacterized protein LOC125186116 n=1 Tax=Salvia hispanica TaxID=49212 RepID=UPI0020097E6F|nr:uncharacterized protein LOC125186116 [Salvia hispanica]